MKIFQNVKRIFGVVFLDFYQQKVWESFVAQNALLLFKSKQKKWHKRWCFEKFENWAIKRLKNW